MLKNTFLRVMLYLGLFITLAPNVLLFIGLTTSGTFNVFIGCFIKSSVQTFQQLIVIYRSGNFEFRTLQMLGAYALVSYQFDSLNIILFQQATEEDLVNLATEQLNHINSQLSSSDLATQQTQTGERLWEGGDIGL